jgi:hypothetical protein
VTSEHHHHGWEAIVKHLSTAGISSDEGSLTFDGEDAVAIYGAVVLESAAALYLNTGMTPNRAYTPTRMRDSLNAQSGSKAKNLRQALKDHVVWFEAAAGKAVNNPTVLKAIGEGQ